MLSWLRTSRPQIARPTLALETLERRDVPAINIVVNYSLDSIANGGSGFFQNHPAAITVMNEVAREMGNRVSANLAAIAPGGVNSWSELIDSPETGELMTIANRSVPKNTIVVYVGAHAMNGGEIGYGATGGDSWSGSLAFGNAIDSRDWSGFSADNGGLWGGSIQFASNANWYFGLNPAALPSDAIDFYSVATHELGHVLGAGTSPQWLTHVRGTSFVGAHSEAVYGGPVPLASPSDLSEWSTGLTIHGKLASEDPVIPAGTRVTWTSLDEAALLDVGWNFGTSVPPPVAPSDVAAIAASSVPTAAAARSGETQPLVTGVPPGGSEQATSNPVVSAATAPLKSAVAAANPREPQTPAPSNLKKIWQEISFESLPALPWSSDRVPSDIDILNNLAIVVSVIALPG